MDFVLQLIEKRFDDPSGKQEVGNKQKHLCSHHQIIGRLEEPPSLLVTCVLRRIWYLGGRLWLGTMEIPSARTSM